MISQLAAPATSAAVTPTSSTATRPTSPPAGPTEARRPAPSGPPENFAQSPMTTAVSVPVTRPQNGAASNEGVGAIRTVISPASAPARYGSTSTKKPSQAGKAAACPTGTPGRIREGGTAPSAEPDGEIAVPMPNEKPGPSIGHRPDDGV